MTKDIDWKQIEEWTYKYLVRSHCTKDEYHFTPIESTEGDYLIMPDGTKLLDMYNQLMCVNLGQRNPKIIERITEALDRYGFLWDIYTTDYKATVAKLIIEDLLGDQDWPGKVRFTNTGADSVETAINLAKLYTGRPLIATREHGYHGVTAGAVALTRYAPGRNHMSTIDGKIKHVPGQSYTNAFLCPAPNCYRCSLGLTYPECKSCGSQLPCVTMTEKLILSHGVEQVAAIITEPIQGSGTIAPPEEYFAQINEMKNRIGILWIVDEVMMGFGRLGTWFGYQRYGKDLRPDIITMAKGITSSALPCAGVVISKEISEFMDTIRWNHVSTFAGHPIAMAAAQGNIEYMIENNIPEVARKSGEYFEAELRELEKKHKTLGYIAGSGLFWQVELVKNKETREPFDPADRYTKFNVDKTKFATAVISAKCMEKGVLLGGCYPNSLRIAPSLTISKADMDKAIDAFDYALDYLDSTV